MLPAWQRDLAAVNELGLKLAYTRKIMAELDLAYPKFIDYAVPGNRRCGVCPQSLPDYWREYCDEVADIMRQVTGHPHRNSRASTAIDDRKSLLQK